MKKQPGLTDTRYYALVHYRNNEDKLYEQIGVYNALGMEGYAFETAADGAEALRRLAAARPAVVLLDMRMPVVDGWGFARLARERGHDVPILVMTAALDAGRWAEEIGAYCWLAKPFDLDALLAAVARHTAP